MYTKKPFENDPPSESSPYDRRSVKRRHLIYYLRVWDRNAGEVLGHLVDITTEGFMLISEKKIPIDAKFNLEVRLPGSGDKEIAVRFRAQSMWASEDVNPAFQDTGFMLLDNSLSVLDPIQDLIDQYGFQD